MKDTRVEVRKTDTAGGRPFAEMRDTGLLWLINTSVFHPRGFALAFHRNDDGTVSGWSLMGDGTEPWTFGPESDSLPEGDRSIDECFRAVNELLT